MSKQKKQHYVPQFYLKNFTGNRDNHNIFVIHKDKNKIFSSNIRDVAIENNFYTIKSMDNPLEWEELYGKIESNYSPLHSKIIKYCSNYTTLKIESLLNRENKRKLAEFILIQWSRGKSFRQYIQPKFDRDLTLLINQNSEAIKIYKKEKEVESLRKNEDFFRELLKHSTIESDLIDIAAPWIIFRKIIIYKIHGDSHFITSDDPVLFINMHTLDSTKGKNGLFDRDTAIIFPISEKLLLVSYESSIEDGKIFILDSSEHKTIIDVFNQLQYKNSYNQSYSADKNSLESLK